MTPAEPVCVVRVSEDVAEMVFESIAEPMANAVLDDFARMPYTERRKWREKAARFYGFPTYDRLREEVLS